MKTNMNHKTKQSKPLKEKRRRSAEDWKELLYKGCFLGMALFSSTVICISLQKNAAEIKQFFTYTPVAFVAYLLIGCLILLLHERPDGGLFSTWMKGIAGVYWCDLFVVLMVFGSIFIPGVLRIAVLVNWMVLLVCWIIDYRSMLRAAKELNGEMKKGLYLVEDLEEYPKGVEGFCTEIEAYCRKNGNKLEFIKRDKPAEILMNGEPYHVELDSFYSQFGPMYALRFKVGRMGKASSFDRNNTQ